MHRILFVDDEQRILDGLRRLLRDQRSQWEMTFALGTQEAFERLRSAPFDVVVTDMRMPGMDGATLLARVKEEFPSTVRIVLSGHTEVDAGVRAIPVAHQFLTKPCDAALLKETISRTCALRAVLVDPELQCAIGELDQLPSMPRVYAELSQALAEPGSSLATLAAIIQRDPAMCAKLLHLVNSAFFAPPSHLSSIQAAINCLGTAMLRNLVLSIEVFGAFKEQRAVPHFSIEAVQRHALLSASIAKRLLPDKREAEDAFMGGMLHDVGVLVLATRLPDRLQKLIATARAEGRSLAAVEESMGVRHDHIGGYLLGLWGLPHSIVEAVTNHHAPGRVASKRFDVLGAVHVANVLAHEQAGAEPDAGEALEVLDMEYLQALGVVDRLPEWRAMAGEQASAKADAA